MEKNIIEWLHRVLEKWLLHTGIGEESLQRLENFIIICIMVAISFLAMEIAYRVALFLFKRIEQRRQDKYGNR